MLWWGWLIFGFVLLAGELLTPGAFYIFFFGLGALFTGAISPFIPAGEEWIEWLLFSVFSIALLFVLRPRIIKLIGTPVGRDDRDSLIGQAIVLTSSLAPGQEGQADMRGTTWKVKNIGALPILVGEHCSVRAVNGLILEVSK